MWKSDLVLALQCSSSVLGRESQIPHGRPWLKSQPSGLKNIPGMCICVQDPAGVGWRNGGAKDDCMTRPTVGCSLSLSPPSDVTKNLLKKKKKRYMDFFTSFEVIVKWWKKPLSVTDSMWSIMLRDRKGSDAVNVLPYDSDITVHSQKYQVISRNGFIFYTCMLSKQDYWL